MNKKLFTLAVILALTSCGSDKDKNKPVLGESFFDDKTHNVDAKEAAVMVDSFFSKLPPEVSNDYWPRNGYVPGDNLTFSTKGDSTSETVGSTPDTGLDITSAPVVADGMVFTLGGNGEVQARTVGKISKLLWETKLNDNANTKEKGYLGKVTGMFSSGPSNFIGGNTCYSLGTLYVTTKRGFIYAISAKDGSIIWSKNYGTPIRSTPIARESTLVFITSDNRTVAVNGKDGSELWKHQGLNSTSRVFSSPAPLLIGDKLIVPYSSGELYALNFNTGAEFWNSSVTTTEYGKLSSSFLSDISQSPVYHNGLIYVVSSDGTLNALDINGAIVWAFEGKVINKAPWGVGEFLFTTTRFGELLAITAHDGKLVWKNQLADAKEIDEDDLQFTGPIVASGKIYVADNNGTLYTYSVKDGSTLDKVSIESDVFLSPVIASGRMYLLSRDAKLTELK